MSGAISFMGTTFDELGLVLRKNVVPPSTQKEVEIISIPDGETFVGFKQNYKPVRFTIECDVVDPSKLRALYILIQNKGRLVFPELQCYYNAVIEIEEPEPIVLLFCRVTLNVTCEPFAYALNEEETEMELEELDGELSAIVRNDGSATCNVIYKVVVDGDLTMSLRDKSFTTRSEGLHTITVDTEKRTVVDENGNNLLPKTNEDVGLMQLMRGHNLVKLSRNVRNLSVTKKERSY